MNQMFRFLSSKVDDLLMPLAPRTIDSQSLKRTSEVRTASAFRGISCYSR